MDRYREIGLKLTPQRLAVLEFLEGNKNHPSAEDIYRNVKKRFPTMSFATVYNILEALKKRGYILELTIDPVRKRYDPHASPHHHLICLDCRKIVDVHKQFDVTIPDEHSDSFDVETNHIEFYGLCGDCKNKKKG
jgi:Fur family peroxide stress response transcriptional regulator